MNWRWLIEQASTAMSTAAESTFTEAAASFGVLTFVVAVFWSYGMVRGHSPAPQYARLTNERGGVLFGRSLMNAGYWFLQPVGRTLFACKLAPNTITTAGLLLALAGSVAIGFGRLGLAGVALLGSALSDALDGMDARFGRNNSEAGAVYDAITDRLEEIVVFLAIAFGARAVPWVAALSIFALVASLMNSYVSAKAEVFRVTIPGGRMRRGERAAWVILGCLLVPLAELVSPFTHLTLSSLPLVSCLAVVAVGTAVSATVRAIALVDALKLHASETNNQPERASESSPFAASKAVAARCARPSFVESTRDAAIHLVAAAHERDFPTR